MVLRRWAIFGVSVALAADVFVGTSAYALTRSQVTHNAALYGSSRGYTIGVAVLDTRTGAVYGAGDAGGTFASESVVKVFIAARLLVSGRMTGSTARTAWKMITRSDDASASALYPRVGGDSLIAWVKRHYHVPDLGSRPSRANWWGNTHIRPAGLVKLYGKLKTDPKVRPWLLHAMHSATEYGSDGTYQFFGLPQATSSPAIKQGWGADYDDWSRSADFNTTGYVDHDRYAVAILARGPISTYGGPISAMLTAAARRLLPAGVFPDAFPVITALGRHRAALTGGYPLVIHGEHLTDVQRVLFGAIPSANVIPIGPQRLVVTVPPHQAGPINVRVITSHGETRVRPATQLTYTPPPQVTALKPASGSVAGGYRVIVQGSDLIDVRAVRFNGVNATDVRVGERHLALSVTVPAAAAAGQVPVVVITAFGKSDPVPFTYTQAP